MNKRQILHRIKLLRDWIRQARHNGAFSYYDIMLMHREISALMAATDVIMYDHLQEAFVKFHVPHKLQARIDRMIGSV